MTDESDKPKKGFAGLNSMVSVVDVPEPKIKESANSEKEKTTTQWGAPFEFNLPNPTPEPPFWKKPWFMWTGGIIILLIVVTAFSDKKKEVSPSYNSTNNNSTTPAYTSNYEEMPPIGNDITLTNNQIRFCLSEKIRIEAWETNVNTYSDISVNTFNKNVENFNIRCSSYRYKKYVMETVRREVEARRAELYAEGLSKAALYSDR